MAIDGATDSLIGANANSFLGRLVARPTKLYIPPWLRPVRGVAVGCCGSLWVAVGRCGSLWVARGGARWR